MRFLATLFLVAVSFPVFASDYDEYLKGLEFGPEPQRVIARQMLPREGMRAFPDVLRLMQTDDQLVWRTSRNVLSDIALAVTAKGYEAECADATAQLMNALDGAPQHAKIEIVRLLARIAPAGTNLSKFEPLLKEKTYRSEVIDALVMMGTPEAKDLIAKHNLVVEPEDADAELAYLERTMLSGGNWDRGMELYRMLLNTDRPYNVRSAALTALGRFGDATAIPDILKAAGESADMEGPALMGLESMQGRESYEALLAGYPGVSEQMQLGLLGVMGRKQDPMFLPLLLENAASDDLARKALAFEALVQSELPGGADAITAYVESRPAEDRKFDVEKLLSYADVMRHLGANEAAGKAYLTLYKATDNPEFHDIAFQGVKQFPTPGAHEIILADLDLDNLQDVPVETLIALYTMLDPDENKEVYDKVRAAMMASAKTASGVERVFVGAKNAGERGRMIPELGFVTKWQLIGPFDWNAGDGFSDNPVGAPNIDLTKAVAAGNKNLYWNEAYSGYMLNLIGVFGEHSNASIFAHSAFQGEAGAAQIRVGSDDGVRVWLNGEVVHENNTDRGVRLDEDVVPVTLHDGKNELIVQVTQGGGGWAMQLRVTKSDGTPIKIQHM